MHKKEKNPFEGQAKHLEKMGRKGAEVGENMASLLQRKNPFEGEVKYLEKMGRKGAKTGERIISQMEKKLKKIERVKG